VVEEMWQKFDEDHDGRVSKKEFQDHWDEAIAPFDKQIRNSMYNYEVENF
jgi:Ca2+-binding EF-hand superfamily protein